MNWLINKYSPIRPRKKRGRKPKESYIVSNNNINIDANKEFVENIIIHLPIKKCNQEIYDDLHKCPSSLLSSGNIKYEINDINSQGVFCQTGSCCEIYLEKAFNNTLYKPIKRLDNAKLFGENLLF